VAITDAQWSIGATGAISAVSIDLGDVALTDYLSTSATVDPGNIVANTCVDTDVAGLAADPADNDICIVGAPNGATTYNGLNVSATCFVDTGANTVTLRICNPSAAAIDLSSGTWRLSVFQ
jgi:hypothetical protein